MIFVLLALVALAALAVALVIIAKRTTISIIVRKDPDMATIKERLALLEASHPDFATKADFDALSTRVGDLATTVGGEIGAINAEIGIDPAPAPVIDPATGLPA